MHVGGLKEEGDNTIMEPPLDLIQKIKICLDYCGNWLYRYNI